MRSNVSCPLFKGLQRLIQLRWCKKASNQNWDDNQCNNDTLDTLDTLSI